MRAPLFTLGLLTLSLAACGPAPDTDAADAPDDVAAHSAALGSCFNNSCNGQDPGAAGCDADATTVASSPILSYGTIAIRYSPSCSAAWARVSSNTPQYLRAQISRAAPPFTGQAASPTPTTALRSPMVGVSAGKTVTAAGYIGSAYGLYQYVGQVTATF